MKTLNEQTEWSQTRVRHDVYPVMPQSGMFAFTWTILMLYGGVTKVSGIPEDRASYAVQR